MKNLHAWGCNAASCAPANAVGCREEALGAEHRPATDQHEFAAPLS